MVKLIALISFCNRCFHLPVTPYFNGVPATKNLQQMVEYIMTLPAFCGKWLISTISERSTQQQITKVRFVLIDLTPHHLTTATNTLIPSTFASVFPPTALPNTKSTERIRPVPSVDCSCSNNLQSEKKSPSKSSR